MIGTPTIILLPYYIYGGSRNIGSGQNPPTSSLDTSYRGTPLAAQRSWSCASSGLECRFRFLSPCSGAGENSASMQLATRSLFTGRGTPVCSHSSSPFALMGFQVFLPPVGRTQREGAVGGLWPAGWCPKAPSTQ